MRVLLDTHVALWLIAGHRRLRPPHRELISAAEEVYVSTISLVEIAVKHALGSRSRDPIDLSAGRAREAFFDADLHELAFWGRHAEEMDKLPPLHRDPFDRMLLAQARSEPLRLVTHDEQMAAYGPDVILI